MGVIHKLKTDVRDFILEQKKVNPKLSCRHFTAIIEDRFQAKVSKSSVNSLIKQAGLSMPIGRRPKNKALAEEIETPLLSETTTGKPILIALAPQIEAALQSLETPCHCEELQPRSNHDGSFPQQTTGAIMLRAADSLMRGSYAIAEAVSSGLDRQDNDLLDKIESLIYLPFKNRDSGHFSRPHKEEEKWSLSLYSYLEELQSVKELPAQIGQIISKASNWVRCIKIGFADGQDAFLDAQRHTIWPTANIPDDFCSTLYTAKSYIDRCCIKNEPLILFITPDSHLLESGQIAKLTFYNNKLEEIESISLDKTHTPLFIFGLWPWQFAGSRKIKRMGEFRPFTLKALNKAFYIAEVELELMQPAVVQQVTAIGCALKTSMTDKTRLIILNSPSSKIIEPEKLARLYLNCWPEPQAAYQDFSRKSELFSYNISSQWPALSKTDSGKNTSAEIKMLFEDYLMLLDSYVKAHFLPPEYKNKAFATLKERFYDLKASLNKEDDYICITFQVPQGYPFSKEIEYACQRLNEAKIMLEDEKRIWFLI